MPSTSSQTGKKVVHPNMSSVFLSRLFFSMFTLWTFIFSIFDKCALCRLLWAQQQCPLAGFVRKRVV